MTAKPRRPAWAIIVFALVALIVGVAVLFVAQPRNDTGSASPSVTPSPPLGGGVPVDENEGGGGVDPGNPTGEVVPFITSATLSDDGTRVTVHAFVPGITEDGGACRVILTGNDEIGEASGIAYIEVATTSCPPLEVPISAGATQGLSVVVYYESPTASGQSERVEVRAP